MADTVDDTENFTIALESEDAVTCTGATPNYATGCDLLNHYDADNDGKISMAEMFKATDDNGVGIITKEELEFVVAAYNRPTINDLCTGCYSSIPAAKGEIDPGSLDYPVSVKKGSAYDIYAATTNIGAGIGKFVMELHVNGSKVSRSAEFNLAAGATSTDKIPAATAPLAGESMSIVVKCIRIT